MSHVFISRAYISQPVISMQLHNAFPAGIQSHIGQRPMVSCHNIYVISIRLHPSYNIPNCVSALLYISASYSPVASRFLNCFHKPECYTTKALLDHNTYLWECFSLLSGILAWGFQWATGVLSLTGLSPSMGLGEPPIPFFSYGLPLAKYNIGGSNYFPFPLSAYWHLCHITYWIPYYSASRSLLPVSYPSFPVGFPYWHLIH